MKDSVKTQVFEGVFVTLLLIAIFMVTFGILALGSARQTEIITSFQYMGVKPTFDSSIEITPMDVNDNIDFDALQEQVIRLQGEIPEDSDALIELAVKLYNLGGTTAKNAENLSAHCNSSQVIMAGASKNIVDKDISVVKTQNEYFMFDYRIEVDCPLKSIVGDGIEIIASERYYTNTNLDVMHYQKVRNSKVVDGRPTANWDPSQNNFVQKELAPTVYNSKQSGIFELMAYNINADTVLSADVQQKTTEDGETYYAVSMVLDAQNPYTTERVIHLIREGSMDDNAKFETIEYSFELWDNGYFKTVYYSEFWKAKFLLSFSTTTTYTWQFSYNSADANPNAYADCITIKQDLGIDTIFD